MKKRYLKVFVSYLICALIVCSSCFIFVVNAATDVYGSETETCTLNYNSFSDKQYATEQLENSNFSQGLKYWCNKNNYKETGLADGITVSNSILSFSNVASKYQGVASTQFKIPNIQDGDYISAVFKFKGNVGDAQAELKQVRETSSEAQNNTKGTVKWLANSAPADGEWGWATITFNKDTAAATPVANASKNDTFWFGIENQKTGVSFEVTDIKIVKVIGKGQFFEDVYTGEYYSRDYYGTETEGCKQNNFQNYLQHDYALPSLQNYDFSQGLKFWGSFAGTSIPSGVSVENGALKIVVDENNASKWNGVSTFQFKVPGAKNGDYLTAVFKFKGDITKAKAKVQQIKIDLTNTADRGQIEGQLKWLSEPVSADDWGLATITFQTKKPIIDIDNNDTFWFGIASNGYTNHTFYVDDVRIAVSKNNGYLCTDVYNGKVYSQDSIYGTKAAGCMYNQASTSYGADYALDKIPNADFSEGKKYLFNNSNSTQPLSAGLSVTDGVLSLTAQKNYDGFGIFQFKAPLVQDGDFVSAVFKYKGTPSQAQAYVTQIKSTGSKRIVSGKLKWIREPATEDDWGLVTLSFDSSIAVSEIETYDKFWFCLELIKAGDACMVDDIQIVTTTSQTTKFVDVYTGETIYGKTTVGDVNGDGMVDILDLVRMKKYIVGENVSICYEAANLDSSSSEINAADLTALRVLLLNQ